MREQRVPSAKKDGCPTLPIAKSATESLSKFRDFHFPRLPPIRIQLLQPVKQRFDVALLSQWVLKGAPQPGLALQHSLDNVMRAVFEHGMTQIRIVRGPQAKTHNVRLRMSK